MQDATRKKQDVRNQKSKDEGQKSDIRDRIPANKEAGGAWSQVRNRIDRPDGKDSSKDKHSANPTPLQSRTLS